MDQEKIWDYYQNHSRHSFEGAKSRLNYLANTIDSGRIVLTIGVGTGFLETILVKKNCRLSVLDPDEKSIRAVRDELSLGDNAKVGYSQAIPFESSSFDVIIMSEVLEHLEDDILENTLKEVKRVLRPGGAFIGTVPARENLDEQMCVCPECSKEFHRWGHEQSFDMARLKSLLGAHFHIDVLRDIRFVPWNTLNWKGKILGTFQLFLAVFTNTGKGTNIFFKALK